MTSPSLGGQHSVAPRIVEGVTTAPSPTLTLGNEFARDLADLALPWQAADTPEPRLLVLNEPLAADLGLPADWRLLVDRQVAQTDWVLIGSGLRRSKLVVRGADLAALPNAEVVDLVMPAQ